MLPGESPNLKQAHTWHTLELVPHIDTLWANIILLRHLRSELHALSGLLLLATRFCLAVAVTMRMRCMLLEKQKGCYCIAPGQRKCLLTASDGSMCLRSSSQRRITGGRSWKLLTPVMTSPRWLSISCTDPVSSLPCCGHSRQLSSRPSVRRHGEHADACLSIGKPSSAVQDS